VGIREKLNQNPAITTGATISIIVIALIFIGWQLTRGGSAGGGGLPTQAYYTTDENATGDAAVSALFTDGIDKVPPFDKDGKPAYSAYVFSCDGGKTKWVGYLQRYTPDAKKQLEQQQKPQAQPKDSNTPQNVGSAGAEQVALYGTEIKKPGAGSWVKQMDFEKARAVTEIKCPDGTTNNLEAAQP